jgi:hypothetical protein
MSIVVTFNVSDLSAGLTPSNRWEWHGPCEAEVPTDHIAEISKHWNAQLSVGPISECVRLNSIGRGGDELHKRLSAAEADDAEDATLVEIAPGKRTLYVTIGLRPQRYELFRTFVTLHFGRSDLICRINSSVMIFATESGPIVPTYNDFLEGRPLLVLGDSSIVFSAKPPALS